MNIGRNGRDRLVLVDIDEVLKNLWFGCRIARTYGFRAHLNSFVITALNEMYYNPGPGVTSSSFISLNRATPDLNTGLGLEI